MIVVYASLSRALVSSFENDFGAHEKVIADLADDVLTEASLASKQAQSLENELQAGERQKAATGRKILNKFFIGYGADTRASNLEVARRRLEKVRLKALDTLSTYNHQKAFRQIRRGCMPGTSSWVLENPILEHWMIPGSKKSICCTGNCKVQHQPFDNSTNW